VIYRHVAKHPTPRTAALVILWTMAGVLVSELNSAGQRAQSGGPTLLSDAERKDLVVTENGLVHPAFGFAAPHPGPGFISDSARQRQMNDRLAPARRMFVWAFTREDSSGLAVIQVTKGGAGERWFRDFAKGMRNGVISSGTRTVLEDSLIREADRAEFRFAIQDSSGVFTKRRCLASDGERAKAFVVCAMTMTAEPTALDSFREQLSVAPTPRAQVP
jgi:hypothetical protein